MANEAQTTGINATLLSLQARFISSFHLISKSIKERNFAPKC